MAVYVVEDGSIVVGANGYASLDYIRTYAADRGITLSADDDALTIQALQAMDYLLQYSERWQGNIVDPLQPLDWPRENVYLRGWIVGTSPLPDQLLRLQAQIVIEINNGVPLMATVGGSESERDRYIIEDTTGPLTTKWAEAVINAGSSAPSMPKVDVLLSPLVSVPNLIARSYRV